MGIKSRSELRRKKIEVYRARDFADAERWDLEFWQRQSPETRLSTLVAIRDDIKKVREGRKRHLDNPRHQEDVRVLREIKRLRKNCS